MKRSESRALILAVFMLSGLAPPATAFDDLTLEAQDPDLTGQWRGFYQYGADCANYRGEETLELTDMDGAITGTVSDVVISPTTGALSGNVVGQRNGTSVTLTYRYVNGAVAELSATLTDRDTLEGRITGVCGNGASVTLPRQTPPPCPLSLSGVYLLAPYGGIDESFSVSAPANCRWTAISSNPAWPVTVHNPLGQGDGLVHFTVGPNDSGVRQFHFIRVRPVGGTQADSVVFDIEQPSSDVPQLDLSILDQSVFDRVLVNSDGPEVSLYVTNVGSIAVTITGANDCPHLGFRVLNIPAPGFTIQPNATVTFPLEFSPRQIGSAECSVSFSPDPAATATAFGTGVGQGLSVLLNQTSFAPGQTMTITGVLGFFNTSTPIDAYLVAELPGGVFVSLQPGGTIVPGIVPFARNVVPQPFEAVLARYTFTGSDPRGAYVWHTALTRPGTFELLTPINRTTFTVR